MKVRRMLVLRLMRRSLIFLDEGLYGSGLIGLLFVLCGLCIGVEEGFVLPSLFFEKLAFGEEIADDGFSAVDVAAVLIREGDCGQV